MAIIDLRVFVPEVISVLSTFAQDSFRQHLRQIPFIDSILGKGDPAQRIPIDCVNSSVSDAITAAVMQSTLQTIQALTFNGRRDAAAKICKLKQVKSLYGTQLDAFVSSLWSPVHCTHGPPGSGKSFVGVALVLALVIIREQAKAEGIHLGPVLMLSYKNHALDEFLIDVLKWSPKPLSSGMMIRTGKPDKQELLNYTEKANPAQQEAERILSDRIHVLRESRKLSKELRDAARNLEVRLLEML